MSITFDGDRDGLLAITDSPDSEVWTSLLDAAAGVAAPTGAMVRVPGLGHTDHGVVVGHRRSGGRRAPVTTAPANGSIRAAQRADGLQEILDRPIAAWTSRLVVASPDGPVRFERPEDFGFTRAIRDFQEDHVARLVGGGAGANFLVPGAGKTAVTLACLAALFRAGAVNRAVVVAPIFSARVVGDRATEMFRRRAES